MKWYNWIWTGNNIGDEGARMLSEGLESNSTLTTLSLGGDEKEESKWKMINEEWYKWNK